MNALLGQVVFTAAGTPYSWQDVVLAAHLFEIREKVAPSIDDPAVRLRAERAALGGRIGREVHDRVRWHVQL